MSFFIEMYFTLMCSFYLLCRIGSDEEDNDSDQEENQDIDLETAVSRQDSIHREKSISTELNSNGHEYILVNGSINNHIVPRNEDEN